MGKTRLLLLLVFAIFGSLGLFLWERGFYGFAVLVPPVLMVSSFLLFLFSLFRVDKTPNGELYFKESNPYLRLMRYVFGGCDSLKAGQISICKLHRLSILLVVAGAIAGFVTFTFGFLVYLFLVGETEFNQLSRRQLLIFAGIIGGFALLVKMLTSKHLWAINIARGVTISVAGGAVMFALVIMPLLAIMEKYNVAILWAIVYYLGFVSAIVGAIFAAVFLVMAAIAYVPALKETWLGQIFLSAYSGLCHTIHLEVRSEK